VRFLNNHCGRHPVLLTAAIRYLRAHGWQIDDQVLDGLFRGEYVDGVAVEIIQRLLNTVEDSQARDLLYRLSLIIGGFAQETVLAVAAAAPAVTRPRERLSRLMGLWIQRDLKDRLFLSPLVRVLGTVNLPTPTQ